METQEGDLLFALDSLLLDLPMRDGNLALPDPSCRWLLAFRPSYEGWKQLKGNGTVYNPILLDLPMRDGNGPVGPVAPVAPLF